MATLTHTYASTPPTTTSQRSVAMALALVAAIVLSPLYVARRRDKKTVFYRHSYSYHPEARLGSGFVVPVVVAGLVIAIKTTASAKAKSNARADPAASVAGLGGSPWGLASLLVVLLLVLSWQDSVQGFLWR